MFMENPRRRAKTLLDLSDQVEYMTVDTMTTHHLYGSKGKSGAQSLGYSGCSKNFLGKALTYVNLLYMAKEKWRTSAFSTSGGMASKKRPWAVDTNLDDLLQKKLAKIQIYPPRHQDMFDLPVSYIPLTSSLIIDKISWNINSITILPSNPPALVLGGACWLPHSDKIAGRLTWLGRSFLFRSPSIGINDLEAAIIQLKVSSATWMMLRKTENRKLIGVWLAGWCWVFNVKISKVFYVLAAGTLGVICWPPPHLESSAVSEGGGGWVTHLGKDPSPHLYMKFFVNDGLTKTKNWFLDISGRAPYFKQVM